MRLTARRDSSRGDTIVEVLIAIAIVSLVLVSAFVVTQKSAQAVRDSQERSEVEQLLQQQVELVRAEAMNETSPTGGVFSTNPIKYFCMDTTAHTRADFPVPSPDLTKFDTGNYNGKCLQRGLGMQYNLAVTYDTSSGTGVFKFEAHWESVRGGTDDEVMYYRIYAGKYQPAIIGAAGAPATVIPPISVSPVTCDNLKNAPGMDGYADLNAIMPNDWHVSYNHGILPPNPESTSFYNFSPPLRPGVYQMWSVGKDDTFSASASNQSLYYLGFHDIGSKSSPTFQTTPTQTPLDSTLTPPQNYQYDSSVTVTDNTPFMKVRHADPQPGTSNDDVDAYCFAWHKIE